MLIACIFSLCIFTACGGEDEPAAAPDGPDEPMRETITQAIKKVFPGKRIIQMGYDGRMWYGLTYEGDRLVEFIKWDDFAHTKPNDHNHFRLEWDDESVTVMGLSGDMNGKPIVKALLNELGYATEILDYCAYQGKCGTSIEYNADGNKTKLVRMNTKGEVVSVISYVWNGDELESVEDYEPGNDATTYYRKFDYTYYQNLSGLPYPTADHVLMAAGIYNSRYYAAENALWYAGVLGRTTAYLINSYETGGGIYNNPPKITTKTYALDADGYVLDASGLLYSY